MISFPKLKKKGCKPTCTCVKKCPLLLHFELSGINDNVWIAKFCFTSVQVREWLYQVLEVCIILCPDHVLGDGRELSACFDWKAAA